MKYNELSDEDRAAHDAAQAISSVKSARHNARAKERAAELEDTPANVNSVPALRAIVDKIKAILRGE